MLHNDEADELSVLQKRFIPVNIITAALSVVAALSLLLMPFLTVDMGRMMDAVIAQAEQEQEKGAAAAYATENEEDNADGGEGNDPSGDQTDGNTSMSEIEVLEMMRDELDIKIELKPLEFARVAQMKGDALQDLLLTKLSMDRLTDFVKRLTANVAVNVILETEAGDKVREQDVDAVLDAIQKAESGDIEGARADMDQAVQAAALDMGVEWTATQQDKFNEYFDKMIEKGTDQTGSFSMERMVVNIASENLGDEVTGELHTYEDLINEMFAPMRNKLQSAGNAVSAACWGVFGLLAFPACMWALLAILSLAHVFMKNKTFLTWYVKWTGGWPCFIFFVVPFLVGKLVRKSASAATFMSAIGTTTWISGLCFLALVLLSWFWLYPARRKIRRLRRELR